MSPVPPTPHQAAELRCLQTKNTSLKRQLRKHTKKKKHFDITKLPDELLAFKPLATDERVLAAIAGGAGEGSGIPSIHDIAKAYAQSQTDENGEALLKRIAELARAYEDATTDALKAKGWFRRSHRAIIAGNNAFREVYDQVWHGFIETGEAEGVRRYQVAVVQLQDCCDTTVKKQRATDVLTLYRDAARVQPLFQAAMTALVEQCQQAAEKEARLAYIENLQHTDNTAALRQRLRAIMDAADTNKNGKLSRSELRSCVLQAGQSAAVTLTRNRRMVDDEDGEGGTGEQQQRQAKAAVCDLKVDKAWARGALCSHRKQQHLESLSRVAESLEQWILDTVLCGEPFALQQNMFPFDLSAAGGRGECAVEHWVFWSASPDAPRLQEFSAFVSARLQAAHAQTGCSWGYREFERRDSIPGLFHAHVFCRPHAAWAPLQDTATTKAIRQVDEAAVTGEAAPAVAGGGDTADGKPAPSPPAPDAVVLKALFPGSASLACVPIAEGRSSAQVYAVALDGGANHRAVVKVGGSATAMQKEANGLSLLRGLLGPTAVPAVLEGGVVEVKRADGSTRSGLAIELVANAETTTVKEQTGLLGLTAPSLSVLLHRAMARSAAQLPARVSRVLRDVFGPGGILQSLAARTTERAPEPGPAAAGIARRGHAASMAGPRFARDQIARHLKRGSFQTWQLEVFRQTCLLAPIDDKAEGVTGIGLREVVQDLQRHLREHGQEEVAASLEDVVLVRRRCGEVGDDGDGRGSRPVPGGAEDAKNDDASTSAANRRTDPGSMRYLTGWTHSDLTPRNILSRGGGAPPCVVDVVHSGPGRYVLTDVARLMFWALHETPLDTAEDLGMARQLSDQLFGEAAAAATSANDLHVLPSVDLEALTSGSSRLRIAAQFVLQLWQYCGPLVARCGGTALDLHPVGLLLALHDTAAELLLDLRPRPLTPLQQQWVRYSASVLGARVSGLLVEGLDLAPGAGGLRLDATNALSAVAAPRFALADVDALLAGIDFGEDGELDYDEFAASPAAINLLVNAMAQAECERALHDEDYEGDEHTVLFDFELTLAPGLKKVPRIIEKSALQFGPDKGDVSCVKDVVRAMVVVQRMDQVALVVEQLRRRKDIVVVRLKERFVAAPSAGGWRDLMVSFYLRADAERKHICELQVVHEMMLAARKGLPGHVVYGRVRNAMELLERDRGSGAAADALALADLLDAVGPGRVLEVEGGRSIVATSRTVARRTLVAAANLRL